MTSLGSITLLINGLTLSLSLSFLLITLWQDLRKELNQFFAIFLFMVVLWNMGTLLAQVAALMGGEQTLGRLAVSIIELGFSGSSIAVYILTAVLIGLHTRRFRFLAFSALLIIIGAQVFQLLSGASIRLETSTTGTFIYQPQLLTALFYLFFDVSTFFLVWRFRRKIRSRVLSVGLILFVGGQTLGLLNPELQSLAVSTSVSAVATLLISFAILQREIIDPLAERNVQVEAMHKVSLAITSQLSLNTVLDQITRQAAGWLGADAAGIFLEQPQGLELVTVYNLPSQFVKLRLGAGEGMAGTAVAMRQALHVANYRRDWNGTPDLPLARETFGSVICVPLVYASTVTGALMVIAGQQGRLFDQHDVHLLELLGAQAAVAIAHSQFFAEQQLLTQAVDAARSQLEIVLSSTQSPVLAVDRRLRVIFVNPAAKSLFAARTHLIEGKPLPEILRREFLPPLLRPALHDLRKRGAHVYEVNLEDRIYLCHVAALGEGRAAGWVTIMNDVTQLKELDRLKSDMVRMTSHDLKNPLQAAMANLELLQDDLRESVDTEVQHSITEIGKQLDRMNRIINGILDMERLKSGGIARELCQPQTLAMNAIEELWHLANEQAVALTCVLDDDLPMFLGDARQFERALINLIENAIKFTPAGGKVIVHVECRSDELRFIIEDTGVGIPAELHGRIFDRFFRGRQAGTEHIAGSGLGLSLVKTVVDHHGGDLSFTSTPGKGSSFVIALPAAPPNAPATTV